MSKNRILSLVLALVMVLGAFGTVFADTVSPAKTQVEAAAFLKDKGVLAGNAAGDLMLEKELRRRDSVILFSKLLNEFDVAKEFAGEPTYTDIKKEDGSFKDPAYVPFLKWGQENEYYVGKPNGEFGWDANLTAQEYSKVLLVALGYTVNGEGSDVKWEEATNKAKDLGVFKGFEKVEETKEILRGEMALMTFNALGIKIKGTEQTLAAKLGIELPEADKPAELKIEKVYTENLAEVEIELSNASLVDKAKLENADNYRIAGANDEKIKVANAEVIGDNVRLTLVPYDRVDKINFEDASLLKDRKYDLTIRNVDRRINEKVQKFTAKDNAIPAVEKVEFMGDYGIKVTTSEPIRNAEERFFQVNGKRTSMIVEQYGREIILTPYHNGTFDKDAKDLVIGKLEDFAGFRAIETKHDLELAKEDVKPVVKNVYRNGKVLTVVFEEDVFHKSVKAETTRRDLGNVSFRDGRVDFYANTAKKIDSNIVRYEFKREIPRNVEVTISDVANHFNTKMETVNIVPELLKDDAIPYIIKPNAKMNKVKYTKDTNRKNSKGQEIADATMTIVFDKENMESVGQDKDGNINVKDLKEHFELYHLEVANRNRVTELIKSAKVVKDEVKVEFQGINVQNKEKDFDYVLEVKKFTDKNGNRMETTYIDFEVVKEADDFDVVSIEVRNSREYSNSSEIVINFTEEVNKTKAEEVNNYYLGLNGTGRATRAYVERDGKVVSLLVRDKNVQEVKDMGLLEISSNVKDLSDDVTVSHRFWDLKTGRFTNVKPPVVDPANTNLKEAKRTVAYKAANNAIVPAIARETGLDVGNMIIIDGFEFEVKAKADVQTDVDYAKLVEDINGRTNVTGIVASGTIDLTLTNATGVNFKYTLVAGNVTTIKETTDGKVISAEVKEELKLTFDILPETIKKGRTVNLVGKDNAQPKAGDATMTDAEIVEIGRDYIVIRSSQSADSRLAKIESMKLKDAAESGTYEIAVPAVITVQ